MSQAQYLEANLSLFFRILAPIRERPLTAIEVKQLDSILSFIQEELAQ